MSDESRGWSRRHWLGAGVAALAGCAAPDPVRLPRASRSLGRVVVVGGGFGGATAARYLRLWGGEGVQVTLVERQPSLVSCPMSNLVVAGAWAPERLVHGYGSLQVLGVQMLQGEATAIDAAARRVLLANGHALPYDRLVLSPGIDFMTADIAGLPSPAAQAALPHAWKAGPQTVLLRDQLADMKDGGVFAITIPPAPYRCPPGPYERACLVADYLRRHKPRSKVMVLDANPEIQSKKVLFERAFARYGPLLEYRPNAELREVDAAQRIARFDFEDVRADVLNVIPPQRAADLARNAGLVTVNGRWVGVDWLTMASIAAPEIHVIGDAVFPGPQMPKSGHMANQHGKLVASAILQLLRGEAVEPSPLLMNTCYSFADAQEAMHVASVHRYDASAKGFVPVPGAGGLSDAPSAEEGRHALGWAAGIWQDVLG